MTHGDIAVMARAVRRLPEAAARAEVARFMSHAHAADLFRKRLGRAHPVWGNGSLSGAVLCHGTPGPEPFPSDPEYLRALLLVIEAVLDWRARITTAR